MMAKKVISGMNTFKGNDFQYFGICMLHSLCSRNVWVNGTLMNLQQRSNILLNSQYGPYEIAVEGRHWFYVLGKCRSMGFSKTRDP